MHKSLIKAVVSTMPIAVTLYALYLYYVGEIERMEFLLVILIVVTMTKGVKW